MSGQESGLRRDEALKQAEANLAKAGIEHPRLDAQLLLAHHEDVSREILTAFPEKPVPDLDSFNRLIERRAGREPLSHIIGKREFWSLDFKVTSDVLDPRPDSETLIETVLEEIPDPNAPLELVDFGTGSGCLLLTILHECPNARGLAVDISEAALAIAQENATSLGLADRTGFLISRWAENVTGKFDIVISNPPYIDSATILELEPEVRHHEPMLALDGGPDGLAPYREIIPQAYELLREDGFIALEIGIGQSEDVASLLRENGFRAIKIMPDLSGIDRCLTARR